MKSLITTLHQSHYKETGKIEFENFPFAKEKVKEELEKALEKRVKAGLDPWIAGRDLWRDSKVLETWLLKKVAPVVLDLLDQSGVRLIADQFLPTIPKGTIGTLFGFQPLLCVMGVGDSVTFYHPSMHFGETEKYYVLFGEPNTCYVKKESDPANHLLKSQGYGFGDLLKNDTHPLIYS